MKAGLPEPFRSDPLAKPLGSPKFPNQQGYGGKWVAESCESKRINDAKRANFSLPTQGPSAVTAMQGNDEQVRSTVTCHRVLAQTRAHTHIHNA
eukprot:3213285-Amphidinium_carterae.3